MSNRLRKNRKGRIWEYLDSTGILEKGSDEEIKAAKRAYRKGYFLEFKRQQRASKPEYTVNFNKANGEHNRIIQAAKTHKMAPTAFIRLAALSYLDKRYIVPDRGQIARLEQLLSDCLNEIKTIVNKKERFFWEQDRKIEVIEKRIQRLEAQISEVLRNPPLLSTHDHQNQIA